MNAKVKDAKAMSRSERMEVSDLGVLSTKAGYILAKKSAAKQIAAARKIVAHSKKRQAKQAS